MAIIDMLDVVAQNMYVDETNSEVLWRIFFWKLLYNKFSDVINPFLT